MDLLKRDRKIFRRRWQKAINRCNKRNIHQLRLSIKRMRALSKLKGLEEYDVSKKRSYARIYRQAGRVREAQVNKKLLGREKKQHAREYSLYLVQKADRSEGKLKKMLESKEIHLLKNQRAKPNRSTRNWTNKKLASRAQTMLRSNVRKLSKLSNINIGNKKLHQIRKSIKSMLEVTNSLQELSKGKKLHKFGKELDKQNKLLGKWHDQVVFANSIKKFKKDHASTKERLALRNLRKDASNRQLRLRKKIMQRIHILNKRFQKDLKKESFMLS